CAIYHSCQGIDHRRKAWRVERYRDQCERLYALASLGFFKQLAKSGDIVSQHSLYRFDKEPARKSTIGVCKNDKAFNHAAAGFSEKQYHYGLWGHDPRQHPYEPLS